ncbi:uncharacterized protein LOC134854893 [Symsagittifera roscoffensis]|uniref:uncharacterized protein LOC134854893 n=1 Tax=Symsagittifera roscoffensis TaxID=84072 RepID=UPI00307BD7C1
MGFQKSPDISSLFTRLLAVVLVLLLFRSRASFVSAAAATFTYNTTMTTFDSIGFEVSGVQPSDGFMSIERNGTLAFVGVLNEFIIDNGSLAFAPTSSASLQSAQFYFYELFNNASISEGNATMCTAPRPPVGVAAQLDDDGLGVKVSFGTDPRNQAQLNSFIVEEVNGTAITLTPAFLGWDSAAVNVTGLDRFTWYQFRVSQSFNCTGTNEQLLSDGTLSNSIRTAPNVQQVMSAVVNQTTIELTFNVSDVSPALEFRLIRNGELYQTFVNANISSNTFLDTEIGSTSFLTPATNYTYRLDVYDSQNDITVTSDSFLFCTSPAPPDELTTSSLNYSAFKLSWDHPDGGGLPDVYEIDYYSATDTGNTKVNATVNTTAEIGGLQPADDYTVSIISYFNCAGAPCAKMGGSCVLASDQSTEASFSTAPSKPEITALEISSATGDDQIMVSWIKNTSDIVTTQSVFKWNILRSSDGGSTYDTIFENETYLTDYQFDSGLLPATLYFYKVQSFYRSAASVESNADTACTYPTKPENVEMNTINSTHFECSWNTPTDNGDQLAFFEVGYNELSGVLVTKDSFSNITYIGDPTFPNQIIHNGGVTCYVRSIVNCSDEGKLLNSSWASALGFLAPAVPSVRSEPVSDSAIRIQVVPNQLNYDWMNMTATIYRDGISIAEDIEAPWIFEDNLDVEPGKMYSYSATVDQNGNPSSQSAGKLECAKPAQPDPDSVTATAVNTTSITVAWSIDDGEVDHFLLSSQKETQVEFDALVDVIPNVTDYEFTFSNLRAGNCYTFEILPIRDCNTSDLEATYSNATNYTGEAITVSACARPRTPGLEVGPSEYEEMVIHFNITDNEYSYQLWRSSSVNVEPDFKLNMSDGEVGIFHDRQDIEGGYVYCYKGRVTKSAVESYDSPVACSCSIPNPVTDLAVGNQTDEQVIVTWLSPSGNFTYATVKLNDMEANVTGGAEEFIAGDTASGMTLTPNTPYSVKVFYYLNCPVNGETYRSPETSVLDHTSPQRPVMILTTGPVTPSVMGVQFWLSDGTGEFQMRLERDGGDVDLNVSNPYVDTSLTPATAYNYTGYLIGNNGELSPPSQVVFHCTHPEAPLQLQTSTVEPTAIRVSWENPPNSPDGYYITLDQLQTSLVTETVNTNRVAAFTIATGDSARYDSGPLNLTVDAGSALVPATQYKISVTGCIDCDVTDFDALQADDSIAAVTTSQELCSQFATLTAHTKPDIPTCYIVTEDSATLQLYIEQSVNDGNKVVFMITRNDQSIPLVNLTEYQLPFEDNTDTVPGTEYVYSIHSVYFGQIGDVGTCVGCTKPLPPVNFVSTPISDTSISLTWDNSVAISGVDSYEVSPGPNSWSAADALLGHNFTGLDPSSCYDLLVRAKVDCDNDTNAPNKPEYSDPVSNRVCTKPSPCLIKTVNELGLNIFNYSTKMAISMETEAVHSYSIYRDGESFIEDIPNTEPYYLDDEILAGSAHCYQCSATLHATAWSLDVDGEPGTPVCGCSRPGEPIRVDFVTLSPFRVQITWAAPGNNDNYNWFHVKDSNERIEVDIEDEFLEWPVLLEPSTPYQFKVRTVLRCNYTGQNLTSEWVAVTAYTSPGIPILKQVGWGTDFIALDVENSRQYDSIRLFFENDEYEPGTNLKFPMSLGGLVPGTRYSMFVIANKYDLYNTSETLTWCTDPEVPTNLDSVTRYFYGFYVTFDPPNLGDLTGYEVWSDADVMGWHPTNISGWSFAEHYYFYNLNVPTDTIRTLNLEDSNYNYYDLAYGQPASDFSNIVPGSTYTVKVRAFKTCQVKEHTDLTARSMDFYSESISGTATTGPHPVVKVETFSVSQSEIQITWEPFGQHSDGVKFNLYRYHNGSNDYEQKFEDLNINQLPFIDTGLLPASLYTYEVSVIHLGIEIFDQSRIELQREYFRGNASMVTLNDTVAVAYYNTTNREAAWRGTSFSGYDPTFTNVYEDISARHNIRHIYFREKTACTYPPNPSSISWFADTHTSTGITWSVPDYSQAQSGRHPVYGSINTTVYLFVNGELQHTLPEDYSTTQHIFTDLPNPKAAYTCEVAVGLTCPDDKILLDVQDYGNYNFQNGPPPILFEYINNTERNLTAEDVLMSYDSTTSNQRVQIPCYTRPTPVTILSIQPGETDPTTELTINYSRPETEVKYEAKITTELSESPPNIQNRTIYQNETLDFVTFGGLVPGQAYNVELRCFWQPTDTQYTIYSLVSPYQNTTDYVTLTNNGQAAEFDPVYGCTDPGYLENFEYFGVDNQTVGVSFLAPLGVSRQYYFQISPQFSSGYERNLTSNHSMYAVQGEEFEATYDGFGACERIDINVSSESGCGAILSRQYTHVSVFTYTTPNTPFWVPETSTSDSNSAITLTWNDTNVPTCPTRFMVYRDGVASSDPDNNGTSKSMTDDTGLTAGTTYEYRVSASAYGETSPPSDIMVICTKPDPPDFLAYVSSDLGSSFTVGWRDPVAGEVDGFLLSDNQGHSNMRVIGNRFKYNDKPPGAEFTVSVNMQSYLECDVTGVEPIRELVSDSSYISSLTVVVTAPMRPILLKHSSTAETTFVMQLDVPRGLVSRIRIRSNLALPTDPLSEEGLLTSLSDATNNDYMFYPHDQSVDGPTFLVTFNDLPDDGTKYKFEVFGLFDGSIDADEASKPAGISYKYKKPNRLLGLPVHEGAILLAAIIILALILLAALVVGAIVLIAKIISIKSTASQANNAAAENEPPKEVDFGINRTYDLRTEYLAARIQVLNAQPAP